MLLIITTAELPVFYWSLPPFSPAHSLPPTYTLQYILWHVLCNLASLLNRTKSLSSPSGKLTLLRAAMAAAAMAAAAAAASLIRPWLPMLLRATKLLRRGWEGGREGRKEGWGRCIHGRKWVTVGIPLNWTYTCGRAHLSFLPNKNVQGGPKGYA